MMAARSTRLECPTDIGGCCEISLLVKGQPYFSGTVAGMLLSLRCLARCVAGISASVGMLLSSNTTATKMGTVHCAPDVLSRCITCTQT